METKMKALKTCQVLWIFGGVSLSESASTKAIFVSLLLNVISLANLLTNTAMIIPYLISNADTIGKDKSFYLIYQFLGFMNGIVTYTSTSLVKRKVGKMVDSLQQLVQQSEL